MLLNAGSTASQGLSSVHVRDRAESPRTARVHLPNIVAERGVRIEASPRTADSFTAGPAKGELGPPPWLSVCVRSGLRRSYRRLTGGSMVSSIRYASPSMRYASSRPVDDVGVSCLSRAHEVWSEVAWRDPHGCCGRSLPSGQGTSVCTWRRRSDTPAIQRRTSVFAHGSEDSLKSRAWLGSCRGGRRQRSRQSIPGLRESFLQSGI